MLKMQSHVVGVSNSHTFVIAAEGLPTEVRRYLNMTPFFVAAPTTLYLLPVPIPCPCSVN